MLMKEGELKFCRYIQKKILPTVLDWIRLNFNNPRREIGCNMLHNVT